MFVIRHVNTGKCYAALAGSYRWTVSQEDAAKFRTEQDARATRYLRSLTSTEIVPYSPPTTTTGESPIVC